MNKLLNTLKSLLRRNFCDLSCLIFFSPWKGRMFVLSLCFIQDQEKKKKKQHKTTKHRDGIYGTAWEGFTSLSIV